MRGPQQLRSRQGQGTRPGRRSDPTATVRPVNSKLARRSEAILKELTGCDREAAHEALRRAEGDLKAAILLLEGCEPSEAVAILARTGGRLDAAKKLVPTRRPAPAKD